ncbi:hypothetical protein GHK92_16835 [Nocardioides sp. dk4132]|uniref:ABC transporter permease n=1 Tax=unclassified Nocardioides TaxID=2615069 RepID=UPI00129739C4|nr:MULTISPECIES: ABC transporter permease [unclassified Nocardioides]MQW77540.1 hypothetical protein [Nocardioides sp. dk4132]QGA06074.1 hypothetical protein GFH29_00700 [Nocardioides sp. dk884]
MSADTTTSRPHVQVDPRRTRGVGGVLIVLRRELATKFLTRSYLVSTLFFALLTLLVPFAMGGDDDEALRVGHTPGATQVAAALDAAGGDALTVTEVRDAAAAERLLEDGELDAVVVPGADSHDVLVEESLDPGLAAILQGTLRDKAVQDLAVERGAGPGEIAAALDAARIEVVPRTDGDATGVGEIMLGLGFAGAAVVVILLWGIPLATDVMQEKVSRVVEILLTSVRPWQLLAGKVVATTIIGVTQLAVVLAATWVGLRTGGSSWGLGDLAVSQLLTGAACLALAVVTCSTLMAGLAARVERQDELSSALQPAMAVSLLPFSAAVYLAFEFSDTVWLDVASLLPMFNVFTMPARMAVEPVPGWQLALTLVIGALTAVLAFAVAGRVYAGSVLRSGGRVQLRDALASR